MSYIENYDNYEVDIADIYCCERSYFFSKDDYDHDFASKLLDKIQLLVQKHTQPAFGSKMRDSSLLYYNRNYEQYVKSLDSIYNRLTLGFFFVESNCFVYDNSIIISRADSDYPFWFILKLGQYDGNILQIANFLDYQFKNDLQANVSDFLVFLKLCLNQYPERLSSRVIETTNDWIQTKSLENSAYVNDTVSTPITLIDETIVGLSKGEVQSPLTSNFIWTEKDPILKSDQLTYLREELIYSFLIEKIKPTIFVKNFEGIIQKDNTINWIIEQYPLIYFIEKLKPFLNSEVYVKFSGSVSITAIAPHFSWKGKPIIVSNWNKTKSQGARTSESIYDKIDRIIKGIPVSSKRI